MELLYIETTSYDETSSATRRASTTSQPAIVVDKDGEGFTFDPDYMVAGEFYPFVFQGHRVLAKKEEGGKVNFYAVEE